jgi:hypothetical protein
MFFQKFVDTGKIIFGNFEKRFTNNKQAIADV